MDERVGIFPGRARVGRTRATDGLPKRDTLLDLESLYNRPHTSFKLLVPTPRSSKNESGIQLIRFESVPLVRPGLSVCELNSCIIRNSPPAPNNLLDALPLGLRYDPIRGGCDKRGKRREQNKHLPTPAKCVPNRKESGRYNEIGHPIRRKGDRARSGHAMGIDDLWDDKEGNRAQAYCECGDETNDGDCG
ncbi:hypothetical protein BC938DRAFT_470779 [Jimgerdemannia flammicorona]|uniref:Uncharacterized protein n=1 Tax=Jimgerdemannia flammicorona TaxID=994334 RepID=A0A433Q9M8_9FUNG|nr:hypothetical protein BC938DRAFT_470779 [Jimgerdemannia flammicorona]